MSDIIERLGGPHEWGYRDVTDGQFIPDNAPFEATVEIDRLRAKVEQKSADLSVLAQRIEERDTEIDRLRAMSAGHTVGRPRTASAETTKEGRDATTL